MLGLGVDTVFGYPGGAVGISRPVTKWNKQVRSAADVREAVLKALAVATSGRPGPGLKQMLEVPSDGAPEVGQLAPWCARLHRAASADDPPAGRLGRARRDRLHRCRPAPDVGSTALVLRRAESLADSGGAGTMGYGLPAAIGAQIAHPHKTVVCVSGGPSILMNIQELATARQHRTPVKVVLCNNGWMGMVRPWQELVYGGRYSESYNESMPDFVAVARGFGWQAAQVSRLADLDAARAECLNTPGPYFLDVRVAAEETCFPMIPAGRGHHEVLLGKERP